MIQCYNYTEIEAQYKRCHTHFTERELEVVEGFPPWLVRSFVGATTVRYLVSTCMNRTI